MDSDIDRRARFEAIAAQVYEPLQRYLGRRAHPDDASEVLNDTLLTLWRRLDDVPRDDVRPWSYGVAKRCLANNRRANTRRLRLVDRVAANESAANRGTFSDSDGGDERLAVALAELEEAERELIRLWAWEELEPREIAIALDTSANAVSLRLTRAKKKLASVLERQNLARAGHEGVGHSKEARP